ncbi:epoxyqueuosine reductase QueH [Candidatus Methylacidithermus pantelleriae]|uniref:Epoxyqueuosine reductase QueH n=1 Tax=Candidatus Methylacidithermus pantelleriae TaxID=2744239 RepID=A0A8J2BMM5_9BACT|nr:epoxyqueuosine reductase QueH [Candidatus Methylacidithermus pantelleriae]CAF0696346.1 Epoxyqueuosine reductase QueH [Candidatus Methylacidithermus pantelleriae]
MKHGWWKDWRLDPPGGHRKVLLHSCCAPCCGPILEALAGEGFELCVFFYNPNIHPRLEYELRKKENWRFAEKLGIPCVDGDYEVALWMERTRGLEWEPERGQRCTVCFDLRMERTADFALAMGYPVFATSLGISRWKDIDQVNASGLRAAASRPGVQFWPFNWRKKGGSQRMIELAKEERFYQQEYCGCVYSLRDTNRWRRERGRPKIQWGLRYYGVPNEPVPEKLPQENPKGE